MPQAIPIIGAVVSGASATAVIGQAVVGIGLSIGASYLARKLQAQPSTSATTTQGMQLSLNYDPNGPRQWAFGTCASAGTLVYHNAYGPNGNDYLQLALKLADTTCDSIVSLYVDGKSCSVSGSSADGNVTGSNVSNYSGNLWAQFHDGAWSQTADADLVAKSGGEWTSSFRGRGVCYLRTTAKYSADKFKNGRPNFVAVFKGAKLYDWRKDSTNGGSGSHRWDDESTWEWTANPAVILYNYMRGVKVNGNKVGGMNVPASALPVDVWTEAANVCDENVNLKAGGTEKRYRASGLIDLTGEHATVVRDLLSSMAGSLVDAGGVWKLYAGAARSSVLTLTDADLLSEEPVTLSPRLSRSMLVNAVFGSYSDPSQNYQQTALPPRISPADETADGGSQLVENYGLPYVTSGTQGQRILEIFRRRGRYQRVISLTASAVAAVLEAGDWITLTSDRYGLDTVLFEVVQATSRRDMTTELELREVSNSIYAWTPASDELDPNNPKTVGAGGSSFTTVQNVVLANVTVAGSGTQQRPGLHVTWDAVTDATVVQLALEYRKVGDTTAQERTILDPTEGSYTWVDGVQGGIKYEVRLKPITAPVRGVAWTGWTQVPDNSNPQIVAVAELADAVPPDTITPDMLSAQARFELALTTAADDVLGSVAERVLRLEEESTKAHLAALQAVIDNHTNKTQISVERNERLTQDLALAQQITTISAQINTNILAAIQDEQTARATADGTLAQDIATAVTRLDGNEVAVVTLQESINGIEGRWGVAINANGQVVGIVQLDGAASGSTFTVVVDTFKVAKPGTTGGAAVPIFSIQNVNGVAKIALRGDMIADGTITAQKIVAGTLSALSANLGTVTAGLIRDPANTYYWDLTNGRQGRYDGTYLIDMKNKTFRIEW